MPWGHTQPALSDRSRSVLGENDSEGAVCAVGDREGFAGWGRGLQSRNPSPTGEKQSYAVQKPHRTHLVSWTEKLVAQRKKLPFLLILNSQKGGKGVLGDKMP